ncbi:kz, partial [Symbiodinium sp. KB8]
MAGLHDESSEPPRLASDTNAEVLPSRREKAPKAAPEAEEVKKMSKRKKRKLEQLAQKQASKELRTQVLEELKAVQLTAEQAELLRASQSTRLSKRQQKAMAQRRAQLGVPLTSDMKDKLKRRPRQLRRHEDGEDEEGSIDAEGDEVSSEDEGLARSSSMKGAGTSTTFPPEAMARPGPSAAKAQPQVKPKAKAEAKALAPGPAPQPLIPVRVQRTASIEEQRSRLPAVMMEQEFVEMVLSNDVMLVCGDTGCGKSTQVPQFLYEHHFGSFAMPWRPYNSAWAWSMCALALSQSAAKQLPRLEDARELFASHLPCPPEQLRRVYLRLALLYHPDKCSPEEQREATELFQAIAAAYEELLQPEPGQLRRVKSRVAAAAELGELQELRRLLEEDAGRATELDDLGVCPLMFACAGGCLEAVGLLAEFRADVQAKNPINWSVLLYASLGNHAHVVSWLVEQGVEVTSHELVLAAYTGNAVSLAALLDRYKWSVTDLRTESGKSLLHLACEGMCFLKRSAEDHALCVDLVLQQRIPIDQAEPKQGRSCLQNYVDDVRWTTRNFEASDAHMWALERLCEEGASVSREDSAGHSALSLADANGLKKVREILFMYVCGVCNGDESLIGVTQPRRVGSGCSDLRLTVLVSATISGIIRCQHDVSAGEWVRYDKSYSTKDMRIKFMTDGILLREVQADFLCRKYAAIVIDEWAMKEQFSSSECTMNNLTEHTVLGRIGTVAMGLGCGGVYEKVKLVTAPGMLDVPYDVGDENCSGAPLAKYLSPMLCVASNVVDGYLSRMPTCHGEQRISCYYSNSDCTGSQMCGGSATDLNKCYASGGGRYAISSILGSDDEVAELCTTTTTTAFAGISGTISIYTDGGCSVLGSTEPINLGPCTLTGSTSSIDFTCMEGSIAYNAYSTDDCSGEATTQVLEQGPCIPMDNGTSSWIVAFPGCTGLQAGHKHLAVVRVFSTEEELQLLMDSVEKWDKAGAIPCTTKSSMSEIDLILVYSKDLEADAEAKSIVGAIEAAFHSDVYGWMSCFSNIKSMSANLNPEQDVYDNRGYTTNKHWVSGPNAVFSKIMMAMM